MDAADSHASQRGWAMSVRVLTRQSRDPRRWTPRTRTRASAAGSRVFVYWRVSSATLVKGRQSSAFESRRTHRPVPAVGERVSRNSSASSRRWRARLSRRRASLSRWRSRSCRLAVEFQPSAGQSQPSAVELQPLARGYCGIHRRVPAVGNRVAPNPTAGSRRRPPDVPPP